MLTVNLALATAASAATADEGSTQVTITLPDPITLPNQGTLAVYHEADAEQLVMMSCGAGDCFHGSFSVFALDTRTPVVPGWDMSIVVTNLTSSDPAAPPIRAQEMKLFSQAVSLPDGHFSGRGDSESVEDAVWLGEGAQPSGTLSGKSEPNHLVQVKKHLYVPQVPAGARGVYRGTLRTSIL